MVRAGPDVRGLTATRTRRRRGNGRWLLFLAPALAFYVGFMAIPLLNSIRLSFYTGPGLTPDSFAGLANYRALFGAGRTRDAFLNALGNTAIFFAIHMLVQNTFGLLFAELLSHQFRGRNAFRAIVFLPATLSVLVTGFLWTLMLNPRWGTINHLLDAVGLDSVSRPWLGDTTFALPAIALASSWQNIGLPTIIFMAGLIQIPDDLLEAAALDGASRWRTFWSVKLPLLRPVIGIVAILTFVGNFTAFDIILGMASSRGEPNYSTDLLATLFYRTGISGGPPTGNPDAGLGAAIATVTFLILAIGASIWLYSTRADRERS
jgi:raffinose/stachyose/melibiose transport system permease protein